jgi:Flp pilus assembly CpaF family ATPase
MEASQCGGCDGGEQIRLFHHAPQDSNTAFGRFPIEDCPAVAGANALGGKLAFLDLKMLFHPALKRELERCHGTVVLLDFRGLWRRGARTNHADVIREAIAAKKNILVVGSTGSGKTTLVNAILREMAEICPQDRVVCIEDTTELQCAVKNYVDLRAVGSVTMLDCLRASMRLKPTRIIVGEVRGAEAHTLLKAWNTGHPGGAATIHANDALSGLVRLESLVAEATAAPQQVLIAEAVDVVVFIDEDAGLDAGRKVKEVALVTGYRDGRYQVEFV